MNKKTLMTLLFACVAMGSWGQSSFFRTDSALIRGRIVDESGAMGLHTLTSQISDLLMGENKNVSAEIREDGTFEKRLLLHHPIFNWFFTSTENLAKKEVPFYLCPGDTLDITITFNGKDVPDCTYSGGHAEEVKRLLQVRTEYLDTYLQCYSFEGDIETFNHWADSVYTEKLKEVEACAKEHGFTPFERQLMLCDVSANFGQAYLSYFAGIRAKMNQAGSDASVLARLSQPDAYRVLRRLPNDDALMMASMYEPLYLNKLEYHTILRPSPATSGWEEDDGEDPEDELLQFRKEEEEELRLFRDQGRLLFAADHDMLPIQLLQLQHINDATSSLVELREEAEKNFHMFLSYLSHPQVKELAQQSFQELMGLGVAFPLPEGAASEFVREILASFPGRYIVLDFWAMWCGPCRQEITQTQEARQQIRERSDMKFVFLANENNPTDKSYQEFVSKHLAGEHNIAIDDKRFLQLQDLFGFAAIPFNVTLTPDGRIVQNGLLLRAVSEIGYDLFIQQLEDIKHVCE